MKTFWPGLRTEILLGLTVLLVSAMILTNFVITRVWERDLLRQRAAAGKALIKRIQAEVEVLSTGSPAATSEQIRSHLVRGAAWMAPTGLFEPIIVRGRDGALWIGSADPGSPTNLRGVDLASAFDMEKDTYRIDRKKDLLNVTSPLFAGDRPVAVVQVPVRIDRVVSGIRRSQQIIWFYIGLNVVVLLGFGTLLLSRIVIRPVKRLVKTINDFEDTEDFSLGSETDHNEIAILTVSLKRMLKRLAENKERMAAQIGSLKEANQELKEAREVVLRSEELSSLGRLAAGVVHEVGNPIGSILGYTDLLKAHVENDGEARDYVSRIESEITRINTIVRELLDFSRASPGEPAPVDVNATVGESVSFFSHQKLVIPVEFETRLEKNAGMVWGDAAQLKQVLINLLFNACDAMEGGGRISILSRRKVSPAPQEGTKDLGPKETVEICVSDTGSGIPDSELEKIFDPFFTTKPPGKGTGLGLAVSLRIVESFGGTLDVESTPGQGSRFTIRLDAWKPEHGSN